MTEEKYDALLTACLNAWLTLNDMTFEEFAKGGDQRARAGLQTAIAKAFDIPQDGHQDDNYDAVIDGIKKRVVTTCTQRGASGVRGSTVSQREKERL